VTEGHAAPQPPTRRRLRELGIVIGRHPTGPLNAITDVEGVRVGHATIVDDEGPARTGVTAILPNAGNIFMDRVVGGSFVLNGAGEVSGLVQVQEWGLIETPILLTNTLAVGTVAQATVQHMVDTYPGIGQEHDVIIPLVGECDDSWINDIAGQHIEADHVFEALESARGGRVAEGNVGGGTGMVSFDLSGGIGTASRVTPENDGGYLLGVLVMSNVGRLEDLRVDGIPVGARLAPGFAELERRVGLYGSLIAVLATDAPLNAQQLNRLCKRVALGVGRVGSYAAHGSGEIMVGFSTANTVSRKKEHRHISITLLADHCMDSLYQAAIECTEEAVVNALCMAQPLSGISGHRAPALPLDELVAIVERFRPDRA
jgi:D-aminopeptidase